MNTLAEKKRKDDAEMAAHRARLDAWLGPDDRKPDPWRDLPKTKGVWNPLRPLKISLMLGAAQETARSDTFRHKPHEFGKFGRPVARADRGRILALARELNAQTRSPKRQGVLKATGLSVLTALLFRANPYTGRLDPSAKYIARKAGVSVRTVHRAKTRLRLAGLLSWRKRFQDTNRYFIGCQNGSESIRFKLDKGENGVSEMLRAACEAIKLPVSLLSAYALGT